MARFVHWPSGRQVKDHVFNVPQGSQALLTNVVAVAECQTDFEVKLIRANGQQAAGSAKLNETRRQGSIVPLTLSNFQDGDQVFVLHKVTRNSWSVPLTIRVVSRISAGSSVSPEVRAAVMAAVRQGKIQGDAGQLTSVEANGYFSDSQHVIVLADAMYFVLAALSRLNTLSLMSMMRYDQGPHGKFREDGTAVCSAMDIQAYAGLPINLINGRNVENTIAGIVKVIDNLSPGEFALGLTRPSPYPKGPPMPDKDVFLPMKTMNEMYKVGYPLHNPTPQFVNKKAAEDVNAALSRNSRARMNRMFPDGPDHLHLEVISATSA